MIDDESQRDPLERMLATPRPLEDDGFTDRVMAQLPPKRRRAPRALILLSAAGLGTLVTSLSPARAYVAGLIHQVVAGKLTAAAIAPAGLMLCIVVVLAASVAQVASD